MNILILTPDSPYPTASGASLRNYGIIRELVAAGHQVTVLTFVQETLDPHTNPLYEVCAHVYTIELPTRSKLDRILSLITTDKADIELRLASETFQHKLIYLLQNQIFDVIQFSGIELASYLDVIQTYQEQAKVIYDALNAEAELQRLIYHIDRKQPKRLPAAIYSLLQTRRIERFERELCQNVDGVIAVSDEDREFLRQYEGAPIFVMSNGIYVNDYSPPSKNVRNDHQIVFTGKMDYRPNVDAIEWFAGEILPRIHNRFPSSKLIIVGRNPHPRIQPLAAQDNIEITGWVDSVQPYLHEAGVFVVPLRMGSGTRLKILEAMASGCAVVSTSIGAAGLNDEVKSAIKIADEPDVFAKAVVSLIEYPDQRDKLGKQAMRLVKKYYDWSALIPQLLSAYREIGLG